MDKKLLKQLVVESYKNGKLDGPSVFAIADHLNRSQLKMYIKALKLMEKKRNIYVELATDPEMEQQKQLATLFPERNVVIHKNAALLTGMRITDNDDIFEMNLKQELDDILDTVNS